MLIRQFKKGDESALLHVYYSAIHHGASDNYTNEQLQAWAPADMNKELWAQRLQENHPFVAELNGEIVAYADVQPNGYIDHFFVSNMYSRQGIGSLLMERIHQEAERLNLNELTSNVSKAAEGFFIAHGFQVVAYQYPVRRGIILQNARMKKALIRTLSP